MKKKTIIDVRMPSEFALGHASGSINIPLPELAGRLEEVRGMSAPVILCCVSGNRSTQAELMLKRIGIDCINAGSWMDVDLYLAARKL